MAEINSFRWIELGALAPGQSHYWFLDPSWDAHGWVFEATAYPEPPDSSEEQTLRASRVEVTELFILRKSDAVQKGRRHSQINITVTNCGDGWAAYSLWVASVPTRTA